MFFPILSFSHPFVPVCSERQQINPKASGSAPRTPRALRSRAGAPLAPDTAPAGGTAAAARAELLRPAARASRARRGDRCNSERSSECRRVKDGRERVHCFRRPRLTPGDGNLRSACGAASWLALSLRSSRALRPPLKPVQEEGGPRAGGGLESSRTTGARPKRHQHITSSPRQAAHLRITQNRESAPVAQSGDAGFG